MDFSQGSILPLLLAVIFREMSLTDATVYAYNDKNETHVFDDMDANFGPGLNEGILGVLLSAEPFDGCQQIKPPPFGPDAESNITVFSFVLIARGGCDFALKVLNAQKAGYHAAIVHNIGSNQLVKMSSGIPSIAREIYIPSVFIGAESGIELNKSFLYNHGGSPYIQLYDGNFDPLEYYLVPFIIVIAVCLIAMMCFLVVKCMRDRRRARRGRLSLQRLKKLPVKKFDKGDEYDVCAICLEDYEDGDSLRILPCDHAYHCKCVDPWLTSSKRVCPLCKRRVLSDDESSTSSDDADDSTDDERTPLTPSSVAASPNAPMYATGYGTRNPFLNRRQANRTVSSSSNDTTSTVASDLDREPETQQRPSPHRKNVTISLTNEIPQTSGYQLQQVTNADVIEPEIVNPMMSQPMDPNAYLDSAEAMMAGPSRVSESSIAVLSDVESSISTPEARSCSSHDFHRLDESMTVAGTPINLNSPVCAETDYDQDDIVVIADGSKTTVHGNESEV